MRYLLRLTLLLFFLLPVTFGLVLRAQSYTSYFTGRQTDATPSALGGICLMGGAREDDGAMRWFLEQAAGGDILVLRTSGSDGYNNYFYTELGVSVNSVETLVFHELAAASDQYVLAQIAQAEAIWIAGGDQARHLARWQNTPLEAALRTALTERSIVIGGTSAGMAILGSAYFSANNGTVTSAQALSNPYDARVRVDNDGLVSLPFLQDVITDTHYDNPDRRGRHLAFLARAWVDFRRIHRGIACEERTAVCINEQGMARVFGGDPQEDVAYFINPNCSLVDAQPEQCARNQPLTWDHDGQALRVYAVKGTPTGQYTFDLNSWRTGSGGSWQYWSVADGQLQTQLGEQPDCAIVATQDGGERTALVVYPNPVRGAYVQIRSADQINRCQVYSSSGHLVATYQVLAHTLELPTAQLASGLYWLRIETTNGWYQRAFLQCR